jgi:hypothetical protein
MPKFLECDLISSRATLDLLATADNCTLVTGSLAALQVLSINATTDSEVSIYRHREASKPAQNKATSKLHETKMADHLLFESSMGYSLYKTVHKGDAVGNRLKEVQDSVQDLAKFGKMVELVGFLPFE